MLQVNIKSLSGGEKWDGQTITVSRVPCVGEWVRINYQLPAMKVVRVMHNVDDDMGTVGGITLSPNKNYQED